MPAYGSSYCNFCGCEILHQTKDNERKWLSSGEILLRKGSLIKARCSSFVGIVSDSGDKNYSNDISDANQSVFLHTFCLKFIQNKSKLSLTEIFVKLKKNKQVPIVDNKQTEFISTLEKEGGDLWRTIDPSKNVLNMKWFVERSKVFQN